MPKAIQPAILMVNNRTNHRNIDEAKNDMNKVHKNLNKFYCSKSEAIVAFYEEAIKFTEKHNVMMGAVLYSEKLLKDVYSFKDLHIEFPLSNNNQNGYNKETDDYLDHNTHENLLVYMTPKLDEKNNFGKAHSCSPLDKEDCGNPIDYIRLLHAGRARDEIRIIENEVRVRQYNFDTKVIPYTTSWETYERDYIKAPKLEEIKYCRDYVKKLTSYLIPTSQLREKYEQSEKHIFLE